MSTTRHKSAIELRRHIERVAEQRRASSFAPPSPAKKLLTTSNLNSV